MSIKQISTSTFITQRTDNTFWSFTNMRAFQRFQHLFYMFITHPHIYITPENYFKIFLTLSFSKFLFVSL